MENLLAKIAQKRAKLAVLLADHENVLGLRAWLRTELAYTSNAIEGNTLTRRETAMAISEKITLGAKPIRDYQEALNHAAAYEFILSAIDTGLPVNEDLTLEIHRRVLDGIDSDNAGVYRNARVRISNSRVILPNPLKIPDLMAEFDAWLQSDDGDVIQRATAAHFRLVSIHPFIDGNGRTARLLMNLILMRAGIAPVIIRKIDRRRYLNALEHYQLSGDSERYTRFMLGALSRSLSVAIDVIDRDPVVEREMLTIQKFAGLAKLPVSTVRYWMKQGLFKPAGWTAAGYALFSPAQIELVKNLRQR
jgi:Fic family protein